jgi:hypothetical protein
MILYNLGGLRSSFNRETEGDWPKEIKDVTIRARS